jgi:hypothetical protein
MTLDTATRRRDAFRTLLQTLQPKGDPVRDDDDEYEDEVEEEFEDDSEPKFPGSVMAAGVMWIGIGGLAFLAMIADIVMAGMRAGQQPNGGGGAGSGCCAGLMGIAFLVFGIPAVSGKASEVLVIIGGIIAALLGLLYAGLGVMLLAGAAFMNRGGKNIIPPELFLIMGVIAGAFGGLMILSSVLAFMGRSRYRDWKEYHAPRRYRRRRRERRDEDDDYED